MNDRMFSHMSTISGSSNVLDSGSYTHLAPSCTGKNGFELANDFPCSNSSCNLFSR